MNILIAADFTAAEWAAWLPALAQALPTETLLRERGRVAPEAIDIAIVANPPTGALAGLPRLRLVQSLWAGVEKLLADPTLPMDVPLARMVDPAMNEAMAETALWAVLSIHRHGFDYARQQREARWAPLGQQPASELGVAVLGLGQMGATVAQRLVRNGYRVSGWSTRPTTLEGVTTHAGETGLAAAIADAQVLLNLLPLTTATRGLIDAHLLSLLPPGASVVNLARGAHVVDADLLAALDSGRLRHAVLDVFASEPLPSTHPFWHHPQIVVLPHVAAQTDPKSASAIVATNIAALREGRPLRHLVGRAQGY